MPVHAAWVKIARVLASDGRLLSAKETLACAEDHLKISSGRDSFLFLPSTCALAARLELCYLTMILFLCIFYDLLMFGFGLPRWLGYDCTIILVSFV